MTAGCEGGSPGHVNLVLEEDVVEGGLQVLLVLNVSLVVGPVHLHTHTQGTGHNDALPETFRDLPFHFYFLSRTQPVHVSVSWAEPRFCRGCMTYISSSMPAGIHARMRSCTQFMQSLQVGIIRRSWQGTEPICQSKHFHQTYKLCNVVILLLVSGVIPRCRSAGFILQMAAAQ